MTPTRILLVEDNAADAGLMRRLLARPEAPPSDVRTVATYREALVKLQEERFDLVLLDLGLPDASGLDVVEGVRRTAPDAAILVLSGRDDEVLALRAVQASAQDYLVKGQVDAPLLLRAIRYAMERNRLQLRVAQSLEATETNLRRVIATSADGVLLTDRDGRIVVANPAAGALFERDASSLRGGRVEFPLRPGQTSEVGLPGGRVAEMRVAETEWEGQPALLATLRDVTDRKRAEGAMRQLAAQLEEANTSLRRLADGDPLTGLLNRRGLEKALFAETSRARRGGGGLVALLVDLDDFKRINDTLGHASGDAVLAEVASRLRACLRPSDLLARVGGDEFLALLPDTRPAQALLVANRMRLAISGSPVTLAGRVARPTASFGVATVAADLCSIEELLARTHGALRASKDLGKNRISGEGGDGLDGAAEAREMLARGEGLRAVSQAIVALDGEKEVGREYLARGPRGAFEMPSDFFRICLESDLLTAVDLSCLRTCLAADGNAVARAHLNVFPSTLLETRVDRLLALFPEDRPRDRYVLEISEQQILGDPAYLRDAVRALRAAGLRIAVDDVGFGRSSLESLVVLEPDLVKIDRAYANGVSRSQEKERSLRRLVRVAATLGAETAAEGVESRDDLGVLREMGVAYAQGYVFGKPA